MFLKADSNALIVLTTNMSEETLQKVMRLITSRDVWLELNKLFDGVSENKVYDLCNSLDLRKILLTILLHISSA